MILLIDNYDSFTYNIVHYLGELGAACDVHRNDQISVDEALALKPKAIVLSPGPCTPNEAGVCCELIARVKGNVPLLGICLGHQAIGQVYGGRVVRAPTLMHGKVSKIYHKDKGIFQNLPTEFKATRYHSLIVEKEGFPKSLEMTAHTEDQLVMGLQHRLYPVYGVQFHPESIASEYGHMLLDNFLSLAAIKRKKITPSSMKKMVGQKNKSKLKNRPVSLAKSA